MSDSNQINRWWVVLGAVPIQMCLVAIYAWSIFTPELKEAGWTKLETQIVFATGLATFALFMVFAGKQLNKWGPRKLAFSICGVACLIGSFATALVFPPHHDEATRHFSVHGFLHQGHFFDHQVEEKA